VSAKKSAGTLNGFLDRGARLEGTLTFDDVFRIDGAFKGTIVSGTVRGVIHAKERIEVHAGGRLFAEIHAPSLVVEEGAVIQGAVEAGGTRQAPDGGRETGQ
jgi:cytoskeletal protein CcmA (bactofilin family)